MPGSAPEQDQPWQGRREAPSTGSAPNGLAFDPTELLSRVWLQNLPIMRDRVASLEFAAEEAQGGVLSQARRTEASDIAHKLAGSLGMFGYPVGTDIARVMEQMLESNEPVNGAAFAALATRLREALPL